MVKKNISGKFLIFMFFVVCPIYAAGVLIHAEIGAVIGMLIGMMEIKFINIHHHPRKFLLIAIFINTIVTALLLSIYCIFFEHIVCQRNLVILSLIPAIVLVLPLILFVFTSRKNDNRD